jgi:hypothetical protein
MIQRNFSIISPLQSQEKKRILPNSADICRDGCREFRQTGDGIYRFLSVTPE